MSMILDTFDSLDNASYAYSMFLSHVTIDELECVIIAMNSKAVYGT